MDLSLIYRALAERQVDFIAGDATSGLIDAYDSRCSTTIATTFRPTTPRSSRDRLSCWRTRELKDALASLSGQVTVADMRRMNRAVDADHARSGGSRAGVSRQDSRASSCTRWHRWRMIR